MIKYYSLKNQQLQLVKENQSEEVQWISLERPDADEISAICQEYKMPRDYITAVLDDTENSRYEKLVQEKFNKPALLLIQYPFARLSPSGYLQVDTYPFSMILVPNGQLITVANYEPEFIKRILLRNFPHAKDEIVTSIQSMWKILFAMLWELTFDFNRYLLDIKQSSDQLEKQIQVATENKQLYQIMDIQKSLVFFEEATKDNYQVLQRFYEGNPLGFDDQAKGDLHDCLVEMRQAVISSRVQLKLVEKMNDSFSAIVSTNLNNVMKILTSLTIVLTIPTIVGGLYGMNVTLPFANREDAFWLIFGGTFILCLVVIYYLRKNRFL